MGIEEQVARVVQAHQKHIWGQGYAQPLILIGFMGSGKTTIGRGAARQLGYTFWDTDEEIRRQQQATIPEIFAKHGETGFREIEREAVRALPYAPNMVVAMGGGTPCFYENMAFLNEKGHTVYLKTSLEILVSRLSQQRAHRPLLSTKTTAELHDFIAEKLLEREHFYLQAQFVLECE